MAAETAAVLTHAAAALHVVTVLVAPAVFAAEVALVTAGALADIAVFAAFLALQSGEEQGCAYGDAS